MRRSRRRRRVTKKMIKKLGLGPTKRRLKYNHREVKILNLGLLVDGLMVLKMANIAISVDKKTVNFTATCKKMKRDKQCTIKFCHKCLLNRYGENAEEMDALGDWICPRCRDICNCSCCMKKKGHKPTGILVHTAKATGFTSVSELLHVTGHDLCRELMVKSKMDSSKNSVLLTEGGQGPAIVSLKKRGKENSFYGAINTNSNEQEDGVAELKERVEIAKSNDVCSPKKGADEISLSISPTKFNISQEQEVSKKEEVNEDKDNLRRNLGTFNVPQEVTITKKCEKEFTKTKKIKVQAEAKVKPCKIKKDSNIDHMIVDVVLPPGSVMTNLVGIDLLPNDVGYALQFLEFCYAFKEVLDIRGQPEAVLRDILNSRTKRKGKFTSAVQFIIQLVSFIIKDTDEENEEEEESSFSSLNENGSWVECLKRCLAKSDLKLENFPEDCFNKGSDGYEMLESFQKLRLLTFLCDVSLSTKKMRTYIDEQNLKVVEERRERRNAVRDKERQTKLKLQEEVAKAVLDKNGEPLTIAERDSIISKIKKETDLVRAESLEAIDLVPKKRLSSDAVRTDPVFVDDNGHAFWRLKCYDDSLLLQEVEGPDRVDYKDKWFSFKDEEIKVVDTYISSARLNRSKRIKEADNKKMGNSALEVASSSNDDSTPATNII